MASQRVETIKKAKTTAPIHHLAEAKKETLCLPLVSLHLLKEHEIKVKRISLEKMNYPTSNTASVTSRPFPQELSGNAIIKMARERLLQFTSINSDVASILFSDALYADLGLSSEKYKDFELALLLQVAALNFSNQKFDCAFTLLSSCQQSASLSGNPLQRVIYYFAKALQERIARDVGGMVFSDVLVANQRMPTVDEAFTSLQPAVIECQFELPFCQVSQFTAIQAILDNVASAKRVHLVDLGIKTGSHWPIMMQALADRHDCPIELLKITAVGPSKEIIKAIGKKLSSFAETMKIPFAFKVVVSEIKHLEADFFELEADEVLAVHSRFHLSGLLAWPDHLFPLVETIKKLNPRVMVVTEVEADTNTSIFMDRLNAVLSLCTAVSDCLQDCMDSDNQCRTTIEGVFMRQAIQNFITMEGELRIHRKEKVDFWRAFLTTFGIIELELSDRALCQANLVIKSNPCWSSCTLEVNGKGLLIGWKGTPILNLTVWKFYHHD